MTLQELKTWLGLVFLEIQETLPATRTEVKKRSIVGNTFQDLLEIKVPVPTEAFVIYDGYGNVFLQWEEEVPLTEREIKDRIENTIYWKIKYYMGRIFDGHKPINSTVDVNAKWYQCYLDGDYEPFILYAKLKYGITIKP